MSETRRKLLVFGLDGATWRVMRPLMAEGRLPHLSRLVEHGASGVLTSLPPPHLTPMVWTTIASGKLPDKHGVRDFTATARSVKCKRIWEILIEAEKTIGLWGYPLTWPPKPVPGFIIPDFLALGPETFPPEFQFVRKLSQEEKLGISRGAREYLRDGCKGMRYGLTLGTLYQAGRFLLKKRVTSMRPLDEFYQKRLVGLWMQRDLFRALYRRYRPDFGFFYTNLLDACSHNYWQYYDPRAFPGVPVELVHRYGRVIPDMYAEVDTVIGSLLEGVPTDTAILVCSDHGFTATIQEGRMYLVRIKTLLARLGLEGRVRGFHAGLHVYFAAEDRSLLLQLKAALEGAKVYGEPDPLFRAWMDEFGNLVAKARSEVGGGRDLSAHAVALGGQVVRFEELIDTSGMKMSGMHHEEGIIILSGPGVRKGVSLSGARVEDVTPTILSLLGLPPARDMDGRVLLSALAGDGDTRKVVETYEDSLALQTAEDEVTLTREVEDRLRALGYLE